ENAAAGIQMFAFGLAKKAVLADTFGSAVTWGFSSLSTATSADLILVMFAYTFQIYFDFSGYSDMAVGAALMLNFDLPINFDSPYRALSIRDFWKRWHISLTKWLTKYIYVPLGGNRKGEGRTYLNMMLVFLISGFWHGAAWTFVLWGALHGLLAVLERIGEGVLQKRSGICRRVPRVLRWGVTFFLVNLLWLLFRAESVSQWAQMVAGMAGGRGFSISDGLIRSLYIPGYEVLGLTAMPYKIRGLLLFPLALLLCLLPQNQYRKRGGTKAITAVLSAVLIVWCLLGFTAETNFIYNNF
ncbi:MAG: MBOAT family protein, partial [Lachnospiraceae bacterium]|nr:MBOAT family protein [Lachnospiraceae bacterium]